MTKKCVECLVEKPLSGFSKNARAKDGLQRKCKPCASAATIKWQRENREKHEEKRKRYRENMTPEERSREMRRDNLRQKYNISLEDYDRMLDEHGGVCAICGNPERSVRAGKPVPLAVDHDHATGAVRGLLCHGCNTGIGHLRDDTGLLRSAIEYLERHTTK